METQLYIYSIPAYEPEFRFAGWQRAFDMLAAMRERYGESAHLVDQFDWMMAACRHFAARTEWLGDGVWFATAMPTTGDGMRVIWAVQDSMGSVYISSRDELPGLGAYLTWSAQ